ncbi:MAG: hypothetical protein J6X16_01025 [Bacteroidales bacterium]|nr:hypothetical protein [Bacteroidales bacterium]
MKNLFSILILMFACMMLSGQSYRVGDLYTAPDGSKGIVYFIHPDGSGGWVVALNDVSSSCAWGDASSDVPGLANQATSFIANLMNDTAGYANTLAIRLHQNNNTNYAAGKVDFANGWCLPSPAQLRMLSAQWPRISSAVIAAGGSSLASASYWTSAEYSASQAWMYYFGPQNSLSGGASSTSKSSGNCVRAVRSFVYESAEPEVTYLWSTGDNTPDITVTPSQTTTYTVSVTASTGGSDTAQYTIVVGANSFSEFDIVSETPYVWNGITYSQSGDYTQTFTNAAGCDSVETLHLTINYPLEVSIVSTADTICEGESVTMQVEVAHQPVAVGDILCTDNSIVKPQNWPVAGKAAMGVVFYVDNSGEHGWAVHLNQSSGIAWGDVTYDIPTLHNYPYSRDVIYDLDGYSNTLKIRAAGDASVYPAAYSVDFENGWYLPAIGQLRILFSAYTTINTSMQIVGGTSFQTDISTDYLSSTENSESIVWRLHGGGDMTLTGKDATYNVKVRSVRSF